MTLYVSDNLQIKMDFELKMKQTEILLLLGKQKDNFRLTGEF